MQRDIQTMDAKERKRQQNRLAQRTYREDNLLDVLNDHGLTYATL